MAAIGKIVRPPGKTSKWAIDFGRNVKPRYILSFNRYAFHTEPEAQRALDTIRDRIVSGRLTVQQAVDEFSPRDSSRRSFKHWIKFYLEHCEERCTAGDISPYSLKDMRRYSADYGAYFGTKPLSGLKHSHIVEYVSSLRAKKLGPKTIKNHLGALHAFLAYCVTKEQLSSVPVFPVIRQTEHVPTIISPEAQNRVLQAIPYDRRGAFLAACMGVRPGELRALDCSDFQMQDHPDGQGGIRPVPGLMITRAVKGQYGNSPVGPTKNRRSGWIPISPELYEWILWRLEQRKGEEACWRSAALCINPRVPQHQSRQWRWSHQALERAWNKATEKVGVEVSLYEGSKHSTASSWQSRGMALSTVQMMLRHSDIRSTQRYSKLQPAALVEQFNKVTSS